MMLSPNAVLIPAPARAVMAFPQTACRYLPPPAAAPGRRQPQEAGKTPAAGGPAPAQHFKKRGEGYAFGN